ncbi:MAG: RNA polymerase factor sigma-32 [Deltaproteobacteria bacterium]|nr:RNA polymerase factor sigma-32 [Deltaproteobacteria bacterium]
MTQLVLSNSIQSYLVQINRFPLLSKDEEFELAVRFRKHNDLDAVHKLITSNLRFVVKVAMEYINYGFRLADLIQEGNIGLMKAAKKFDPFKGYRLITYAVWWIRSHIQAFILKNWSLVSKGTATLKKRLFYLLNKDNENIQSLERQDTAANFDKSESKDIEYRDLPLDNEIGEEETTYLDMLPDTSHNQEEAIVMAQEQGIAKTEIKNALQVLNEKERYVIENRLMSEPPLTLQEIGSRFGISRERVRQIEKEAIAKLRRLKRLKALAQN